MPFTPVHSIVGGVCIGLSAFHNARLHARVTGISGALFSAGGSLQAALFLGGLALSGAALRPFSAALRAAPLARAGLVRVLGAGLLVGAGARLGNGCTSGHGVCGVARLRARSLAATATFMASGAFAATALRTAALYAAPAVGWRAVLPAPGEWAKIGALVAASALAPPLLAAAADRAGKGRAQSALRGSVHVAVGAAFGAGLVVSGMASPAKTAAFLSAGPAWDPSLPFVFVGALPIAALGLRDLEPVRKPVDRRLISGAAVFGAGWGALGMCPGPALVYAGAWPAWGSALFVAAVLAGGSAAVRVADAVGL